MVQIVERALAIEKQRNFLFSKKWGYGCQEIVIAKRAEEEEEVEEEVGQETGGKFHTTARLLINHVKWLKGKLLRNIRMVCG